MRATILAAFAVAGLTGASLAGAASAAALTVPLDHSVRLALGGHASSVVVGNPAVADVTVVDSRTLFVSGKGLGSTDVVVVDELGRTIFDADVVVSGPTKGRVAVFRGGAVGGGRTDLACAPHCQDAPKGKSGL